MWQDGLALLIVVIAAWMLFRTYAPKFRFGARRERDAAVQSAAPGCSGCAIGASCGVARVKIHSAARREPFSADQR